MDERFGYEYKKLDVRKLRIRLSRIDSEWLIEYKLQARWYLPWDYFWWYNEGQYVEYADAMSQLNRFKENGIFVKRYKKVQVFDV